MAKSPNSAVKQILFDTLVEMGRLDSNPTDQTIQTINDISDSEALKLLRSLPGTGPTIQKAGGGMMNINDMIRPIGMAAGGPIPSEPEKTGMMRKIKDLFKYENESGTGSLLMDFINSEGMFAPSGKKFDTSDSPMIKSESKMHPLVVFKEMYDQYRIDGGEMSFKEFFDMIQIELNKEASS